MKIKDLSSYDPDTPWLQYINRILSKDIVQVKTFSKVNWKPIEIWSCVHLRGSKGQMWYFQYDQIALYLYTLAQFNSSTS